MTSYPQLSKGDCSEGDISLLLYLYTNFHEIHQNFISETFTPRLYDIIVNDSKNRE